MKDIELWLGDCLELMKDIPDKSVDMILADLPYGQTAPQWDKIIDMDKLWKEYKRIRKNKSTIALFSAQPFTTKLISSNGKEYRYCWYWLKNQGTNFFHAKKMPIRRIEEIVIFGKGKYYPQITDGHIPTNVLEFKCVDNYSRRHSSEKPVALLEYLVKTYTETLDIVLDNTMGSGSTGVACKNLGRRFIGIEKDKKYFDIAVERIGK